MRQFNPLNRNCFAVIKHTGTRGSWYVVGVRCVWSLNAISRWIRCNLIHAKCREPLKSP